MIIQTANFDKEVEDFVFKSSTYSDSNQKHPELNSTISAKDVLSQKWKINAQNKNLYDKIHGQIYLLNLTKQFIPILE